MLVYVLGFVAFLVLVACFSRWMEHDDESPQFVDEDHFVALASPSRTNAFDRRIEAAIRDASRGFQLCTKCLFTSRMRAPSCVLCGASLGSETSSSVDLTNLTRRQLRARSRRKWTRQLDSIGSVVWSRATEVVGGSPAFVLELVQPPEASQSRDIDVPDATDESACEPFRPANQITIESMDSVEVRVDAIVHSPPTTVGSVVASIQDELLQTTFNYTKVVDGDWAGHCVWLRTDTKTSTASQELKDAITNAQADYPTKLAQFVTTTSSVFLSATMSSDGTTRTSRFNIVRESLLSDSVEAVVALTPVEARAAIRVDFVGEPGVDAGGVYREWFLLLTEQMLNPTAGLFVCVDLHDQVYYLNAHSSTILGENHLAYFLACGRLLGRALIEGNVTRFHLALPLLKIILGSPVSFEDLEYYDSETFKSLRWLLDHDGAEDLGLDFTVVEKLPDGTTRVVELVEGGASIGVTDSNKHEFVDRKIKYLFVESVKPQLFAFLKGLHGVVPSELLVLFDAEELDFTLSGSDDINVDDWERSSQNSGNLLLHPALKNFWKVVRELSLEERRRLLQFATGSTRVPPGGFAALTSFDGRQCAFTLHGMPAWRTLGYIRSHACFNRLDLPLHPDLKSMRQAVAAAIAVDAFGFTSN